MSVSGKVQVVDNDLGWKRFLKLAEMLAGDTFVKVGVLSDENAGGLHEKDPVTGKSSPLTVAEIASVHEYGTEDKRIPARPFLRPTFDKFRDELANMAIKGLMRIIDGQVTPIQLLGMMGAFLAAETKKYITAGEEIPPPNVPSVKLRKAKKGQTAKYFKHAARSIGDAFAQAGALAAVRTLVDTGRMVNAITWQVVAGAFGQGMGKG